MPDEFNEHLAPEQQMTGTEFRASVTGPSGPQPLDEPSPNPEAPDKPIDLGYLNEAIKKIAEPIAKEVASKEAEKVVLEKQTKYTEVLGVFVALFTFVSINIQIINKVSTLNNAIIFSLLLFLCLIGFVYFLHFSLRLIQDEKFGFSFMLFGLTIIFIIGLIAFFIWKDPIAI